VTLLQYGAPPSSVAPGQTPTTSRPRLKHPAQLAPQATVPTASPERVFSDIQLAALVALMALSFTVSVVMQLLARRDRRPRAV
jgi:hypothetical protein